MDDDDDDDILGEIEKMDTMAQVMDESCEIFQTPHYNSTFGHCNLTVASEGMTVSIYIIHYVPITWDLLC